LINWGSGRSPNVRFAEAVIVKVCVLATSSAGNCTFVGTERSRILIDAGLSAKETCARLAAIGETPESLDAILITHEHSDHVSGLPVLIRWIRKKANRDVPVFLTRLTAPSIDWGDAPYEAVHAFQAGTGFAIGDLHVSSFTIPHDAIDPVGYTVTAHGVKIGLAMDLGYIPDSVKYHLGGSRLLVMESNHDLGMLKVGPYPWAVKQRVMGRRGHLSNEVVAEFIRDDLDGSVETLLLGHLSEHNNHPAIVEQLAAEALDQRLFRARLVVAEPRRQSEVFVF
jgi:phosphoribosyl 1,2-cyclic phosphodiesterase